MKQVLNPRLILLMVVLAVSLFSSCRNDLEVYKIARLGVLSFSLDNLNKQNATEVIFLKGIKNFHFYPPDNQVLYTRYLLEAKGISPSGNNFILNFEFDVSTDGSYIGIYRPQYDVAMGGIYNINYIENSKSYSLDPSYLNEDFFRIERQNSEEKIILGDFFAKLQNDQDPNDKIVFSLGTFKDISYARF
jgi:hypothetical protein